MLLALLPVVRAEDSRFSLGIVALGAKAENYAEPARRFLVELTRRTQVDPHPEEGPRLVGQDLAGAPPFLWLAVGPGEIPPDFSEKLQRFLASGGTVFAEPATLPEGREALRLLEERLFPGRKPGFVEPEDLITRTFYFLNEDTSRHLSALEEKGRLVWISADAPVLRNVLNAREINAEDALRIGVNVVIYTLTGSYKNDLTHVRYLLRRRKH